MKSIEDLLGVFFCKQYKIDPNLVYNIEWVNAQTLIVPGRFDLIAKINYIKAYDTGVGLKWAEELYRKHIEAFSQGREPGNDEKNSIDAYVKVFNQLISDIKTNGFSENISVIPVGAKNEIMDGAHRVSIAAYFNLKLPIIRFENLHANNNYEFFENQLLDHKYLDCMAYEYVKLDENSHCACVWPTANDPKKIEQMETLMNKEGQIVYKKKIELSYNGIRNLMIQVYSGFDWMGGIDTHFSGASGKADKCYVPNNPMYIYVLKVDTLEHTLELKAKIREVFKIGNHSIHISDTHDEALQISQMLLNDESIFYLNNGKPDYDIDFLKRILKLGDEKICLTDSALVCDCTLAMYGLKKADSLVCVGSSLPDIDYRKNKKFRNYSVPIKKA